MLKTNSLNGEAGIRAGPETLLEYRATVDGERLRVERGKEKVVYWTKLA